MHTNKLFLTIVIDILYVQYEYNIIIIVMYIRKSNLTLQRVFKKVFQNLLFLCWNFFKVGLYINPSPIKIFFFLTKTYN